MHLCNMLIYLLLGRLLCPWQLGTLEACKLSGSTHRCCESGAPTMRTFFGTFSSCIDCSSTKTVVAPVLGFSPPNRRIIFSFVSSVLWPRGLPLYKASILEIVEDSFQWNMSHSNAHLFIIYNTVMPIMLLLYANFCYVAGWV